MRHTGHAFDPPATAIAGQRVPSTNRSLSAYRSVTARVARREAGACESGVGIASKRAVPALAEAQHHARRGPWRGTSSSLRSAAAVYGLNQPPSPSAPIRIFPGIPIWAALTKAPPSPGRGFT
jgi:hypothetical protein